MSAIKASTFLLSVTAELGPILSGGQYLISDGHISNLAIYTPRGRVANPLATFRITKTTVAHSLSICFVNNVYDVNTLFYRGNLLTCQLRHKLGRL